MLTAITVFTTLRLKTAFPYLILWRLFLSKDYVKHIFVTVVAIRNAWHMIDLLLNIYWVNELGILLKVKNQQFSLELVLSNATLKHLILQCSYFSLFVFSFPSLEYNFHGCRGLYLFCWWYKSYRREMEHRRHSINIFFGWKNTSSGNNVQ